MSDLNGTQFSDISELKKYIAKQRENGLTFGQIAALFNEGLNEDVINFGHVSNALKGREPKRNDLRRALRLPVYVLVEVCPDCERPHPPGTTCPRKRKPVRNPRIGVYPLPGQREWVEARAAELGISMSAVMQRLIQDVMEREQ